MEVTFRTNKLKRICEDPSKAQKEHGTDIGRVIIQRISELSAAKNLAVISGMPSARLHPLKGSRDGEFAIDLVHPFRLVFIPIMDSDDKESDYIKKLKLIEVIRIEAIEDYHGKQKRK
jgi:proteic killer suppression protein